MKAPNWNIEPGRARWGEKQDSTTTHKTPVKLILKTTKQSAVNDWRRKARRRTFSMMRQLDRITQLSGENYVSLRLSLWDEPTQRCFQNCCVRFSLCERACVCVCACVRMPASLFNVWYFGRKLIKRRMRKLVFRPTAGQQCAGLIRPGSYPHRLIRVKW